MKIHFFIYCIVFLIGITSCSTFQSTTHIQEKMNSNALKITLGFIEKKFDKNRLAFIENLPDSHQRLSNTIIPKKDCLVLKDEQNIFNKVFEVKEFNPLLIRPIMKIKNIRSDDKHLYPAVLFWLLGIFTFMFGLSLAVLEDAGIMVMIMVPVSLFLGIVFFLLGWEYLIEWIEKRNEVELKDKYLK